MATFGSMTYFLKVGQEARKMRKWVWCMTNSAPDHVLINDPKKLFRKKLYVTIPQWSETIPSMSDLSSDHNSAKCGLALNDPIDWFKLRLNQPKTLSKKLNFLGSFLHLRKCYYSTTWHDLMPRVQISSSCSTRKMLGSKQKRVASSKGTKKKKEANQRFPFPCTKWLRAGRRLGTATISTHSINQ